MAKPKLYTVPAQPIFIIKYNVIFYWNIPRDGREFKTDNNYRLSSNNTLCIALLGPKTSHYHHVLPFETWSSFSEISLHESGQEV